MPSNNALFHFVAVDIVVVVVAVILVIFAHSAAAASVDDTNRRQWRQYGRSDGASYF